MSHLGGTAPIHFGSEESFQQHEARRVPLVKLTLSEKPALKALQDDFRPGFMMPRVLALAIHSAVVAGEWRGPLRLGLSLGQH